ncbi:hypothetical protein COO60DRAFT_516528 [Scenedesmus sp. NREL 46B-D3]|nr:hypothetical protein COO60DRAFT_516528 [Scenedesmus sp. NREL 46B-D3]
MWRGVLPFWCYLAGPAAARSIAWSNVRGQAGTAAANHGTRVAKGLLVEVEVQPLQAAAACTTAALLCHRVLATCECVICSGICASLDMFVTRAWAVLKGQCKQPLIQLCENAQQQHCWRQQQQQQGSWASLVLRSLVLQRWFTLWHLERQNCNILSAASVLRDCFLHAGAYKLHSVRRRSTCVARYAKWEGVQEGVSAALMTALACFD